MTGTVNKKAARTGGLKARRAAINTVFTVLICLFALLMITRITASGGSSWQAAARIS